jgi:hypothetical protein
MLLHRIRNSRSTRYTDREFRQAGCMDIAAVDVELVTGFELTQLLPVVGR